LKKKISDLAQFGGTPAFRAPMHVGAPNIGDRGRLLERINGLLDRRWLSNHGPLVAELESRIAERLKVRHCIALCNGTVALEIAIRALGMSGEVLVPSFTFIATAHALKWQQIRPVFCDVDVRTHLLDAGRLESYITPQTTGIIGVHTWGEPCAIAEIEELGRRRGLRVMFDASHAFDCSGGLRPIGGFGDAEVFSFHATKFFNTFEGGAVTTDNDELAARIRLMKNFGFSGYDNVTYIGTNGKMSEPSAAMGLTNLESLDEFIGINAENYRLYQELLKGVPGIRVFPIDQHSRRNYQYVVLEVEEAVTGIGRDALVALLHAENVLARKYFYPGCHRMEPYASEAAYQNLDLPATEELCRKVMVMPTGSAVSGEAIGTMCGLLRFAVEHGVEISRRAGILTHVQSGG
jgi:dTDP-4-amino-4,6-dideoxygalactose transaminase